MKNQIPLDSLPAGTVLETKANYGPFLLAHFGIVQRDMNGTVLVHHNSKKLGGAVTTDFQEFTDGRAARVVRFPQTWPESSQIVQSASDDVKRGIRWTVTDNCEDLVSRAVTGKSTSPTRNAAVCIGLVGVAVWFLSRN